MGMAIEDGYYLARALDGVDLRRFPDVTAGFGIYEGERVAYVNHNMEFARFCHILTYINCTISEMRGISLFNFLLTFAFGVVSAITVPWPNVPWATLATRSDTRLHLRLHAVP
jgi:hypothetical protein